jgi:hypothetical protein
MILIEDFNYALLLITIVALLIVIATTYVLTKCARSLFKNGNEVEP